jgi:hypothetical protein
MCTKFLSENLGEEMLERRINRWEPIMDLKGMGCEDVDYINLAQDRDQWRVLVKTVRDLRISQNSDMS